MSEGAAHAVDRSPASRSRAAGIALVQPAAVSAAALLGDLVEPQRLWVVSTGDPDLDIGRPVRLPCDRGTLSASLLGLIEVVVEDLHALVAIATPHAPARAGDQLRIKMAGACLEAQLDRPAAIEDEKTGRVLLLFGRADALMRAFARSFPRLSRLFAYAALMGSPERERFLLRAFVGLPFADLSLAFVRAIRSGGDRHRCHGETGTDDRSAPWQLFPRRPNARASCSMRKVPDRTHRPRRSRSRSNCSLLDGCARRR